jgi:hypothetical protein
MNKRQRHPSNGRRLAGGDTARVALVEEITDLISASRNILPQRYRGNLWRGI